MPVARLSQRSLGERVADELRRLLATREIAPGTPIVEDDLAHKFGVSRGPIRDALKALETEGLVLLNGRNSVFRGLSETDVDEMFSLRTILESAAMVRAMERNPKELIWLQDLAIAEMTRAVKDENHAAFPEADTDFHTAAFEVAGHGRLKSIWELYRASINLVLRASRETYKNLAPSLERHVLLRDIVASGDVDATITELEAHIEDARLRVRSYYAMPIPSSATARTLLRTPAAPNTSR